MGPITPPSIDNELYILHVVDDFSNFSIVVALKRKSETAETLKRLLSEMHGRLGRWPRIFRTDPGSEFVTSELKAKYFVDHGILHDETLVGDSEQAGTIERKHRVIEEHSRANLVGSRAPSVLWAHATYHAVYTLNRTLLHNDNVLTPYQLYHGKHAPLDLSALYIFGSDAYLRRPHGHMSPSGVEVIFVGYASNGGWRVLNVYGPLRTVESKHVRIRNGSFCNTVSTI